MNSSNCSSYPQFISWHLKSLDLPKQLRYPLSLHSIHTITLALKSKLQSFPLFCIVCSVKKMNEPLLYKSMPTFLSPPFCSRGSFCLKLSPCSVSWNPSVLFSCPSLSNQLHLSSELSQYHIYLWPPIDTCYTCSWIIAFTSSCYLILITITHTVFEFNMLHVLQSSQLTVSLNFNTSLR